jgi:hypothetical protein
MESLDGIALEKCLQVLIRNPRFGEAPIGVEIRLYRMNRLLRAWVNDANPDSPANHNKYSLLLMRLIKEVWEIGFGTKEIASAITSVLISLGFSDYIDNLVVPGSANGRALNFRFIKLVESKTKTPIHKFMQVREHPIVWQLQFFGQFMDRSMDSQADARVPFKPDAWQREVLDAIDKYMSLLVVGQCFVSESRAIAHLVVAPTSAGKTFISYYAMEKILRGSDDGILVYVAPTKALVAQVTAEIYARFSKDLNGRKYSYIRINKGSRLIHFQVAAGRYTPVITGCMIRRTAKSLSPFPRSWQSCFCHLCSLKRGPTDSNSKILISYLYISLTSLFSIILDEIHTIGQQEGGGVWEQVLLLSPCPIMYVIYASTLSTY